MNGRSRTLAALACQPIDRFPVWLMRQAGRYLPEYREVRAKMSFLELCHSPEQCTEVALQPLRRYPLDATIVFSDILVVPDAMGADLRFVAGDGPSFGRPARDAAAAAALHDPVELDYVYEAVRQLRAAAPDHCLFGFAGSPWTLFCYLVQGEAEEGYPAAMAAKDTDWGRALLDRLTDAVTVHLKAQLAAGADVVQVFDTWGGLLGRTEWEEVSGARIARITAELREPSVCFVRATDGRGEGLATALSVPAGTDLGALRGPTQGNIAPEVLYEDADTIRAAVRAAHAQLRGRRNHVFNLGHGLTPKTPPEAVATFVAAVQELG